MARFVLLAILAGSCGSKTEAPVGDPLHARVPKVDTAAVTIAPPASSKMPLLVFVEEDGKVTVGVGPTSWAALGSFQPAKDARTVNPKIMWPMIREDVALGIPPARTVEHLNEMSPDEVELLLALDVPPPSPTGPQDNPPPPEEEDRPDDGEESGGTGTAMALEEGKMGKKESDRAEGAYKMQKNADDPVLARERARARALPGPRGRTGAFASLTGRKDYPQRLASIDGAIEDPKLPMPPQGVAIAARPKAKARALIEALTETEGALLVTQGTDVRPLRLLFGPRGSSGRIERDDHWVEVRVSAKEIVFEPVPGAPIIVQSGPAPAFTKAYSTLRERYPAASLDVLVAQDVDAQRLVDVLAALDAAGARAISLGVAASPGTPQAQLRGKRIVELVIGRPSSAGGLDNAEIRRVVRASDASLRACYERELVAKPELAGELTVELVIDPKGKVSTATATGLDPAVATCMAGVIKALQFAPRVPSDKSKTQVRLPIAIR